MKTYGESEGAFILTGHPAALAILNLFSVLLDFFYFNGYNNVYSSMLLNDSVEEKSVGKSFLNGIGKSLTFPRIFF